MTGVKIPEQTLSILGQLIKVAQFDMVDNSDVYGSFIPFLDEYDDILDKTCHAGETGYESSYAFVNMGTNVLILTILFFFMGLLLCMWDARKKQNRAGRFHRYCSGIIFWNFWLRMLI